MFKLKSCLHCFPIDPIAHAHRQRIFMIKSRKKVFRQFPKLLLYRMMIIRKTAELHFSLLYVQKDILRAKKKLIGVHKKLCHLFHHTDKSSKQHVQVFAVKFPLLIEGCQ